MGVCSYLVIPERGERDAVRRRIAALPGCTVLAAERHDLLILVADAPDAEGERALRERVEGLQGIQALNLTFAEVSAP